MKTLSKASLVGINGGYEFINCTLPTIQVILTEERKLVFLNTLNQNRNNIIFSI